MSLIGKELVGFCFSPVLPAVRKLGLVSHSQGPPSRTVKDEGKTAAAEASQELSEPKVWAAIR